MEVWLVWQREFSGGWHEPERLMAIFSNEDSAESYAEFLFMNGTPATYFVTSKPVDVV